MPDGNECPACGRDIGLFAIIKAPLPNRIYCPHCRERLWYRGIGGVLVVFSVLLAALVATAVGVTFALVGFDDAGAAFGVAISALVLGLIPFEVTYALVLRHGSYRLESARHPTNEWDDEEF